jgi:hypothetical protein
MDTRFQSETLKDYYIEEMITQPCRLRALSWVAFYKKKL